MIRLLDANIVNQIAAGEVIERPFSAIKELVENSIDAGATRIGVRVRNGGQTLIIVEDNGHGMDSMDLEMCVERHSTSKLPQNDLFNIKTMGFRGEALASIGSIARMTISSKTKESDSAWEIKVEGGIKSELSPCSGTTGTRIEIRDLFFATPARLKFLKSPSSEMSAIVDVMNKLAIAHPHITFTLKDDARTFLEHIATDSIKERLKSVLGEDFTNNCAFVEFKNPGMSIKGYVSLPTFNRGNRMQQFFFVNNRCIQDQLLSTAIRVAYQDLLSSDRYPILALFMEINPEEIDVNVHPTKSQIRFQDPQEIKSYVISTVKKGLGTSSHKTSSTISDQMMNRFSAPLMQNNYAPSSYTPSSPSSGFRFDSSPSKTTLPFQMPGPPSQGHMPSLDEIYPLGHAKAQIHENYIIAQTQEGMIIVDQHAAHERLTYEKMKSDFYAGTVARQTLLMPEIIDLSHDQIDILMLAAQTLHQFGVVIERFGLSGVIVREIPVIIGNVTFKDIILSIIENLQENENSEVLEVKINEILSSKACHASVRSGRILTLPEMNSLLREMEATPFSGQCNHGRPTYVDLKLKDIERLFGRA